MTDHLSEDCTCEGKICRTCGVKKCTKAFYRARQSPRLDCKKCVLEQQKIYNQAHAEQISAHHKAYYQTYAERIKARINTYRIANLETVKARKIAYRTRNLEKVRKSEQCSQQKARAAYPEREREYSRKWRRNHPTLPNSVVNQARYRARKYQITGDFTLQEWNALKAHYNYTCLCCGKQEPNCKITPDHIIPFVKGGSNTIGNIQPLCWDCNRRKREKTTDYRPS